MQYHATLEAKHKPLGGLLFHLVRVDKGQSESYTARKKNIAFALLQ